eukprot:2723726-Pleurochrysis_carterae.AAC.1
MRVLTSAFVRAPQRPFCLVHWNALRPSGYPLPAFPLRARQSPRSACLHHSLRIILSALSPTLRSGAEVKQSPSSACGWWLLVATSGY